MTNRRSIPGTDCNHTSPPSRRVGTADICVPLGSTGRFAETIGLSRHEVLSKFHQPRGNAKNHLRRPPLCFSGPGHSSACSKDALPVPHRHHRRLRRGTDSSFLISTDRSRARPFWPRSHATARARFASPSNPPFGRAPTPAK